MVIPDHVWQCVEGRVQQAFPHHPANTTPLRHMAAIALDLRNLWHLSMGIAGLNLLISHFYLKNKACKIKNQVFVLFFDLKHP